MWKEENGILYTTKQTGEALSSLPVEKGLIAIDDDENEYLIENIIKRKVYGDDDYEWIYALKVRKTESSGIRR